MQARLVELAGELAWSVQMIGTVTWLKKLLPAARTEVLPPDRLPALLFGQQHAHTLEFFASSGDPISVPVERWPHYRFALSVVSDEVPDPAYETYLRASWPYYTDIENTAASRADRVRQFADLCREVATLRERHPVMQLPVRVCRAAGDRLVVIDGNHRVSMALALGLPVRATVVDVAARVREVAHVGGEWYGADRQSLPYQSIYYEGRELVRGRRRDIVERLRMVAPEDLRGRRIVELGSNIGANCFAAIEGGAASAVGFELSKRLVTAAIRIAVLLGRQARFVSHDLNGDPISRDHAGDTTFCFSVAGHVRNQPALAASLANVTGKVLYFEGHERSSLSDYKHLLSRASYSRIELAGYCRNGVHSSRRERPLFRCERVWPC